MSKYTTEVRFICESVAGLSESVGFNSVNEVIQRAVPHIFNFDFPIYDEDYRSVLCAKILKHYYTREIGAETVGLWKLWLDARLNEIMPYYNQLYRSAMIEFNPMYDVDVTTTHNRQSDDHNVFDGSNEGSSKQTSESTNEGVSKDLFSDTPQGALDNLENETYLTNARKVGTNGSASGEANNEFSGSSKSETSITSTEEYVNKVVGKTGGASYSSRLQEFRKTFLNIDLMIINELKDLFFNLW